jgi:hypothetical protein
MLSFTKFGETLLLQEAEDKASGGVTHLTHIEDTILLQGSAGIKTATDYLQQVLELSDEAEASFCVTTKFDGAPAIIVGINPENGKFFVATKSLFNKTPKINYTPKDIDQNHPVPGLNEKLKIALKNLKNSGIRGILQGDMLFTNEDLKTEEIHGVKYLTFRPNTLTYAIPADSSIGKEIAKAKMGVVFHTKYTGDTIASLSPSFAPDISYLKSNASAWIIDANLQGGSDGTGSCSLPANPLEKKEIQILLAKIERTGAKSAKFLDSLQKSKGLVDDLMIYINSNVRQGVAQGSSSGFLSYMKEKIEKTAVGVKKDDARQARTAAAKALLDSIESNSNKYDSLFALHLLISQAKLLVIDRLRRTKMRLDSFTQENGTYTASPPEGFVVVNRMNNRAYKLVDRLDFSRKNFNLPKNWKV